MEFINSRSKSCEFLKDQRQHDVPAEPNARLTKDEDSPERKDKFHYRSLIGQLNYLTASTRPEIQFATHQLARFSENPKMSHEKAAKRVVRYFTRRARGCKIWFRPLLPPRALIVLSPSPNFTITKSPHQNDCCGALVSRKHQCDELNEERER